MFSFLDDRMIDCRYVNYHIPNIKQLNKQREWENLSLNEKIKKLQNVMDGVSEEQKILKMRFDQDQTQKHIRNRYYDYLFFEQILQKQIDFKKSQLIFGLDAKAPKNILDLDFEPIMFIKDLKSINVIKVENFISILSLQNDFCVEEIRLFFYTILNNVRRHLKQFKKEVSTQTELVISVTKEANANNEINLRKYHHKLEYFQQKSPNSNKLLLNYYFMGVKHIYEINDIEMRVEEFMLQTFKQKAESYEIALVKNTNLEQIRIDNESDSFLIEIYHMQNAYSIYILPKSKIYSNINSNTFNQEISPKKESQYTQLTCINEQESEVTEEIKNQEINTKKQSNYKYNDIKIDFSGFDEEKEEINYKKQELQVEIKSNGEKQQEGKKQDNEEAAVEEHDSNNEEKHEKEKEVQNNQPQEQQSQNNFFDVFFQHDSPEESSTEKVLSKTEKVDIQEFSKDESIQEQKEEEQKVEEESLDAQNKTKNQNNQETQIINPDLA